MDNKYRNLIANEFRNCVINAITRVNEKEQTYRPFHTALLSDEVVFWSGFERSFSTSFGQRVIEEVALLVALSNGAESAQRQKTTYVTIDSAYLASISTHLRRIRSKSKDKPFDWNASVNEVLTATPSGNMVKHRVISDLWWRKDNIDHYISLKTVKPNIDQTVVAKEDCLKLTISDPTCKAYFGLPYNPYGERKEDYSFNPPMGIFDFHHDANVLIGKEMWDTIGGPDCYEELLEIAKEVGIETKKNN